MPTGTEQPRLITVADAAERLSLSDSTIRKMLFRGELDRVYPTQRRGCVRLLEHQVDALCKAVTPNE